MRSKEGCVCSVRIDRAIQWRRRMESVVGGVSSILLMKLLCRGLRGWGFRRPVRAFRWCYWFCRDFERFFLGVFSGLRHSAMLNPVGFECGGLHWCLDRWTGTQSRRASKRHYKWLDSAAMSDMDSLQSGLAWFRRGGRENSGGGSSPRIPMHAKHRGSITPDRHSDPIFYFLSVIYFLFRQ